MPTDLAAAFNAARRELLRLDPSPWPRQRAVILFTDGRPTDPRDEDVARVQAIYEAEALAKRGIALYVIRFGPLGIPDGRFLLALAGAAGGRNFPVGDPHRLLNELPPGVQTCHSGSSASDVIPCSARATDAHDRPLRNFAAFRVQGQVAPTGRWGWAFRTVPEFVHSGLRSRNEYLS